MQYFTQGQRWVSNAEPELGLGIVSAVEHRRIALDFRQSGERRLYAAADAPLTRIIFKPGDQVHDRAGRRFEVLAVDEREGLARYTVRDDTGASGALPESELADAIDLDEPLQRLLAGQVDNPAWFELRQRSLEAQGFIERSPLLGLISARTDLIPHQLYIAAEVAQRHAPRVLLADEVGLGKTIEAGLIIQQQLFSGRAARVLIVVPEALLHQWLVEMLRRFTLAFSLYDEERCASLDAEGQPNPFLAEQLVLCTTGFFLEHPERHAQALEADWDLLVVDEAHHLHAPQGAQDDSAPARAYRQVQAFAARVPGLVLLTATPGQGGADSHFALLQLLDPHRFHDLAAFRLEQNTFAQVADLVEDLEALKPEDAAALDELGSALALLLQDPGIDAQLAQWRDADPRAPEWETLRERLIRAILDRHGTGRVLFRNTRKTVSGFPERVPRLHPLPCPEAYAGDRHLLQPEATHPGDWLDLDPRVDFVLGLLERLRDEKILLICARKATALTLEEHLRLRKGIRSSVFHEDMSIVERDRAAAFFAQRERGARILLCSEIGSEGRNFQFSHHLVLFDLPAHPDLLEQRIGRLDRIGQAHPVQIHIPYLEGTAQEILLRWYHEGLEAFTRPNPVAFKLYEELWPAVEELFGNTEDPPVDDLLALTRRRNRDYSEEFARGRDRLLERNSFDADKAARLLEELRRLEREASPRDYLLAALDSFGIEADEQARGTWALQPGEHMLVEHFAGIPDDGLTVTFDRQVALHRDDIAFVTWFHPLLNESIDTVLEGHYGKTAVGLAHVPGVASGSLLLEALYRVTASAPRELQLQRFLPCTILRVLVDSDGNDLAASIGGEDLGRLLEPVDRTQLAPHLAERRDDLSDLAARARDLAQARLPGVVRASTSAMLETLTGEIRRLSALARVNPNVRQSEIQFLERQVRGLHTALSAATLRLEGLRVIFVP